MGVRAMSACDISIDFMDTLKTDYYKDSNDKKSFFSNTSSILKRFQASFLSQIDTTMRDPIYGNVFFPEDVLTNISLDQKLLVQSLIEFSKLNKNWDGYGAFPISKTVISHVSRLLGLIYKIPSLACPEISPLNNGTISVEWKNNIGNAYIEFGNSRFSGYIKKYNKAPSYLSGNSSSLDINIIMQIYIDLYYSYFPSKTVTSLISV